VTQFRADHFRDSLSTCITGRYFGTLFVWRLGRAAGGHFTIVVIHDFPGESETGSNRHRPSFTCRSDDTAFRIAGGGNRYLPSRYILADVTTAFEVKHSAVQSRFCAVRDSGSDGQCNAEPPLR
jgi:hypothetical protein